MQILFGMGFVFAALGGSALMEIVLVVSCFTHCEPQVAGVVFLPCNEVLHSRGGERRVRAQPWIPALVNLTRKDSRDLTLPL